MIRILSLFLRPLNLYIVLWLTVYALFALRVVPFPELQPLTWFVLLLGNITFLLGAFAGNLIGARGQKITEDNRSRTWLDPASIRKLLLILLVVQVAYVYVRADQIFGATGSSLTDITSDAYAIRVNFIRNVRGAESFSLGQALIVNALAVFSTPIFVLAGSYLAIAGKRALLPYMPLVLALAQAILTLSRYSMVVSAIMFIAGYYYVRVWLRNEGKLKKSFIGRLRPRSGFLLLFLGGGLVLLFVLNDQLLSKSRAWNDYSRVPPLIMSIYWYLTAPLTSLDYYLQLDSANMMFGGATLRMFSKWLVLSGLLDARFFPNIQGEALRLGFAPSGQNTYTWLRTFYMDLGVLGVAVFSYFFGFLSSWLSASLRAKLSLARLVAVATLLSLIVFSIMGYTLTDIEQLGAVVAAFIIERLLSWLGGAEVAQRRQRSTVAASSAQD